MHGLSAGELRYDDTMHDDANSTAGGAYRVLARKYRPESFSALIGQEPMVRTLTNAFETGRIAQAYMLTGVRGVGKTTTARILARALNYRDEATDQPTIKLEKHGEHCASIMAGRHMDVIEMDAASHTQVEKMRELLDSMQYRPVSARYKVYIIDEVHMLSKHSFNALLKTLEEPPEHLKFIFATTEIREVPVTILSRCQRFDLRRVDAGVLCDHLRMVAHAEDVKIEEPALALLARASEGSVRDALSLLDQAIAHDGGDIKADSLRAMLGLADRARVIDLFEHVMAGRVGEALGELRSQYDAGAEPSVVLADLADFIHFVTRLKYVPGAADEATLIEAEKKRGTEFAEKLSVRVLGRAWQMLLKGIDEVATTERPLAAAEMVLVRLTHAATLPTPDELVRQLQGTGETVRGKPDPAPPTNGGDRPSTNNTGDSPAPAMGRSDGPASAGGGPAGAAPKLAARPQEEAEPVQTTTIALNRFEELIFLAEDKRDLQMKERLRRNVRLVAFEDGRMEVNLVGDPPANFIHDLSARLSDWTGRRWIITTSREGGAPTLEETERTGREAAHDEVRADPAVAAVIARFPGARIVDVRIREADSETTPVEETDNLDDFFE